MTDFNQRPRQPIVNNTYQTIEDAKMIGPQWDFQSGLSAPGEGKFITDSTSSMGTTWARISEKNIAGSMSGFDRVGCGSQIRFTDIDGKSVIFEVTSITPVSGQITIGLSGPTDDITWAGRYVIAPEPGT